MTSTAISSSHVNQPPSCADQILNGLYQIGVSTLSGALAGYLFTIIDPVGGAIFGATSALTGVFANALAERFGMDQTASKIILWSVSFMVSIAAAVLVTTAAGFPLTVLGALGMTCAMIGTSILVRIGINCFANIPGQHRN